MPNRLHGYGWCFNLIDEAAEGSKEMEIEILQEQGGETVETKTNRQVEENVITTIEEGDESRTNDEDGDEDERILPTIVETKPNRQVEEDVIMTTAEGERTNDEDGDDDERVLPTTVETRPYRQVEDDGIMTIGEGERTNDEDGDDDESVLPTECHKRIKQNVKKDRMKFLKFCFLFVKEVVDCTLDWLLYRELSMVEQGLVVGPVNTFLLHCLFFFCCTGTVFSFIDIANKICDLCTGDSFVNIGYTELCVILLEDTPQLIIGLSILICSGETANVFTMLKALILVVGPVVAFFIYYGDAEMNKKLQDTKKKKCVELMIIMEYFLALLAGATLAVTLARSRKTNNQGHAVNGSYYVQSNNFNITFNSSKYDENSEPNSEFYLSDLLENDSKRDQFFSNVGIYGGTSDLPFRSDDFTSMRWMQFFGINDIRQHGEINMQVMVDLNHVKIQVYYSGMQRNATNTCYHWNRTHDIYSNETNNCTISNGSALYYHFKHVPPNSIYRLGDIQYNIRKAQIPFCNDTTLYWIPNLRYLRLHAKVTRDVLEHLHGIFSENETSYKFYRVDDFVNVDNVWRWGLKTFDGHADCGETGSLSPHFNPDIPVPCQINSTF